MRVPSYPSNREADERAMKPLRKREGALVERGQAGRLVYTVKPIIPLGVGYAIWLMAAVFVCNTGWQSF